MRRRVRLIACIAAPLVLCLRIRTFQNSSSAAVPIQLIVVSSQDEAAQVLELLNRGISFSALARERSLDPTAPDGGFLGRVDPSTLRPELREALRGVPPGRITPVVPIPSGFAIMRVAGSAEALTAVDDNPSRTQAATAVGAVRATINVSGLLETDSVMADSPKPDGWNRDLTQICRIRNDSLQTVLDRLEGALDSSDTSEMPAPDRLSALYNTAQLHSYEGNLDRAIARWVSAKQIADAGIPAAVAMLTETLGVASLHKAEMDNDVYRTPGDRCLFPPRSTVSYRNTVSSEKAVEYFSMYLKDHPDDLEVKWLLNLAYMTLGRYPAAVPAQHLIPPALFDSEGTIGRFSDVAPAAGLRAFSMAGGAIADDFSRSGQLDVVTSSMDVCEPLHYFRNNGDGTFSERTAEAGLSNQLGGLNIIHGDYNNDGCPDILVLRGGWELAMRKSLLRNNCNGTFTDVTESSGLDSPTSTQTAVWADIDNDGFLDLFVGNENAPLQLFRNKGDGTFQDIAKAAGLDRTVYAKAVAADDYDNDGYVDLYVSYYGGRGNLLFHNSGNRTFTEVGKQAGVQAPRRSFGAWFFDYDNDGWPDLFVNSYYVSVEESMRTYLGQPRNAESAKLYRNLGDGTFRDVTIETGLNRVFMPMGANFGDADNDGFLDMYLGMGNPSFASILPHELLLNRSGKRFVSATVAAGVGELHKGHGIAFADLDRDGDEDILAEVGGAVRADRHTLRLFENPGNANDWINIRLVGVKSNRSAIGARLTLIVDNIDEAGAHVKRTISRTVSSGGSFGGNPFEQHVGLGRSARIESLAVWWPASKTRQTFGSMAANRFMEIREFADQIAVLDRRPVKLGGGAR